MILEVTEFVRSGLIHICYIISPSHQHLVALLLAVPTSGFKYQDKSAHFLFFHYLKVLYDYSFVFTLFRWEDSPLTSFCRIKFR